VLELTSYTFFVMVCIPQSQTYFLKSPRSFCALSMSDEFNSVLFVVTLFLDLFLITLYGEA